MKECKPSFEKCILDRCPYFHEYIEIVHGDVHMRIRCEKQDISLTKERAERKDDNE